MVIILMYPILMTVNSVHRTIGKVVRSQQWKPSTTIRAYVSVS